MLILRSPRNSDDLSDPRTVGDHFFAEAEQFLQSNDASNSTTVQALAFMDYAKLAVA